MHFSIRFYSDVLRFHKMVPCRLHPTAYPTREAAEEAATGLLSDIRAKFGDKAGYAILDRHGLVVAVGPSTHFI